MGEHRYARIEGTGAVRRIALRNHLPAPIGRVWRALTQVEQLQHWWPDWRPGGTIEPAEGGRIVLGDGSWIDGTIKVWRPPHVLEFTWHEHLAAVQDADWFEAATASLLRFDLVATGGSATLLNLVQFSPAGSAAGGSAGWHHFAGERLKAFLEDGRVDGREGRFDELLALYGGTRR